MFEQLKQDFKYHPALTAAIFIALISYWVYLYLELKMDIDMGWLLQCLERFLAGGTYTKDFYETNPPLSFLIYLPAYPLYKHLGLDAQTSVIVCFLGYIALSNTVLFKMLKFEHAPIIAALIFAQTWAMGVSAGSKDHLIFIFLPPLCMMQYLITTNQKPEKIITSLAIIMGGIVICLKPHYGIFPALFFLHRLYLSKSILTCMKSLDFLGFLGVGIAYGLFITIFSPSFWDILPEITSLYNVDKPFPLHTRLFYVIFGVFGIVCAEFTKNKNLKIIIYAMAILSLISIIPYLLQDKGWHYHALPMLGFSIAALFLGIYLVAKYISPQKDVRLWIASLLIAMICAVYTTGGKNKFLTDGQYMAKPLVDTIDERAWNRVFATYDFKSEMIAIPYMSDLKNGSRFGQIWPLNSLIQKHALAKTDEERQKIKSKMLFYADMIAEDMVQYKPSVITIPQFNDDAVGKRTKNYFNFLMQNKKFKKNMENYIHEDIIPIDTSPEQNGKNPEKIIYHDVFILKKDHDL